ncbi:MAG: AAA family ATPase [Planctomycetota bacterium]|nr:AAA family ATPase [Planctomycetota bacterium]
MASDAFPVKHVADVPPEPPGEKWLVESLWTRRAVGLVVARPKTGKTHLVVDMAMGVATGRPVLDRFAVHDPGPVLFYGAEDDLPALRTRFEAVALSRGISLQDVPIFLLDVGQLRLDRSTDLARLRATVEAYRPRLLVLDPFVRMVALDENSSQEVSTVLGSLRALQRELQVAVVVVHHMRKATSSDLGNRVRGSGDFAAWYDSALYLTRVGDGIELTASHRSACDPAPLRLRLVLAPAPHLALEAEPADVDATIAAHDPLQREVLEALATARAPLSTEALRRHLHKRKEDVLHALHALRDAGLVTNRGQGWERASDP